MQTGLARRRPWWSIGAENVLAVSEVHDPELVRVKSRYPVLNLGLFQALQAAFRVHDGEKPPGSNRCDYVVLHLDSEEDLSSNLELLRERCPEAKVVVFSLTMDLGLAREALRSGVQGFIHGAILPEQITQAMYAVRKGELVAPRELLRFLFQNNGTKSSVEGLTKRQLEVLELAADGFSNLQIAQRLYLSESSVKQHLRATFRLLGVKSRTEAARVLHGG